MFYHLYIRISKVTNATGDNLGAICSMVRSNFKNYVFITV